jgi:hypothetical protein
VVEAAEFATRAVAATHAAANQQPAPEQQPIPSGCFLRDGQTLVVQLDAPSYEVLAAANRHNKKGTRSAHLPTDFSIKRKGADEVQISITMLWAALRAAGGLHLVGYHASPAAC